MRERYNNDPHFRVLVDMMVGHIHEVNYTPSEMREAAMLASIIYEDIMIYEEHNVSQMRIIEPDVEDALRVIRKRLDE
jgi:hypothetical protein